jgi:hypothetical protein
MDRRIYVHMNIYVQTCGHVVLLNYVEIRTECDQQNKENYVAEKTVMYSFLWNQAGWPDWAKFRRLGDCLLRQFLDYGKNNPHAWDIFLHG